MKILVTNDDSQDSPLLEFLLDELKGLGDLEIVVPEEEQSWTGKSISRFEVLEKKEVEIAGNKSYTVSGRPADCVNFGVYQLGDEKPDLVISGINIGYNCGVSYILSSGTVGACLEANIAGIPALSLSRRMAPESYQRWSNERSFTEKEMTQLRREIKLVMTELKNKLMTREDFLSEPVTWQVEMPQDLADNWNLEAGVLGHSFYGSLFEKNQQGNFGHNLKRHDLDERANADVNIIGRGNVSVAKIDIRVIGQEKINL
ncbi:5'/3'-nucleotidase SurE [Lentisphaera profundi]|uniref:5'-nucleotidase n=1 Tax=Lentisphaera profundi TaxID=1658616 RepID=A0ABY7VVW4_9BACT|nr:5'/3'-nucleotidase SurE [Lentisphaera profundi]WDE98041.1 5'/3'-nucleotidase SurE [Lentisphaera profundi]